MSEAQNKVATWNRQAALNFAAGVMSGSSFAFELSGAAEGLKAETGSGMYAAGQRAGTRGSIAAAITGVGAAPFLGKIGGEVLRIFKGARVTGGPLSSFRHAGVFGSILITI